MTEIIGESIKSASGAEIMKSFPGATWYKEQITTLKYPHFFVHQLTLDITEDRKNRWWISALMNIRYRIAADPTTDSKLQEKLDAVGLQLLCDLQNIYLIDILVKIRNARYEKVDGVLFFFYDIKFQVTKPQLDKVKQMQLEIRRDI